MKFEISNQDFLFHLFLCLVRFPNRDFWNRNQPKSLFWYWTIWDGIQKHTWRGRKN